MNQKKLSIIALIVAALIGIGGYFALVKRSGPATQQPISTSTQATTSTSQISAFNIAATSTQAKTSVAQTSTPDNVPTEQFNGLLRSTSDNSLSLLISSGKVISIYPLQFPGASICMIGPDEGPCSKLRSNFNKGIYGPGGGDSVSISGNKEGDTITVKKLVLNENLIANGHLTQTLSSSAQKTWGLVFQTPDRPSNTVPLQFDAKSGCGDTGAINCNLYTLHQNDQVFVRGILYKGVLIVRLLTIPAAAPTALPQ